MQIEQPLRGSRLTIRSYCKQDFPFVTELWFAPEQNRFLSDPTPPFIDGPYRQALEQMAETNNGYYFVVERTASRQPIGTCCAFPDQSRAVWDIGYCIHHAFWRQGCGTELVSLLLSWIRQQGGQAVTAEVAVENAASNALLRKLGFQVERESEFGKYHMDVRFRSCIYRLAL